jgi:hypothetical protein
MKEMDGDSELQKTKSNTIAMVVSACNIMDQNLDKVPHPTHSIHKYGSRVPLRFFPSNMTQDSLLKMFNKDIFILGLLQVSRFHFSKVIKYQF